MNKMLENDLTIKIISLFVAVVLWVQVTADQNPVTQRTFVNVPLEAANAEAGTVVMEMTPIVVRVTAQSQKAIISKVAEGEIKAVCNLKGLDAGRSVVPVSVTLPQGLELVEVVPGQATVFLDVEVPKVFKPEIKVTGAPSEDFVVGAVELKTTEVTVTGPKTRVQLVQKVTGSVDVTNASGDVSGSVEIRAVDSDGREVKNVTVSPRTAEVRVVMRQLPPAKYVQVKPSVVGTVRPGFRVVEVTSEPKIVKVRGPAESLQGLTSIRTWNVDVTGQSYNVEKQVELIVPAGFSVEQKTVTVKVAIGEDRIEKTFQQIPIRIRNLSPGLKWSLNPSSVAVTVEGRRDQLEGFGAEGIEAFVEARNLGEGDHELKVQVVIPGRDDLSWTTIAPETVILSLEPRSRTS
ncbi:MAG: CdaR family protein [Firmicutes bacterium]|jgi:YbbR domain-containing protein|nr:CdaR family protein [Bacillota bacterium]